MNTCLKYILGFLLGSWLFTGCHYADMLEFNDIPRVSFVGVDKNGSDTYDPTTLAASLNFGENLKGDSISCDTTVSYTHLDVYKRQLLMSVSK